MSPVCISLMMLTMALSPSLESFDNFGYFMIVLLLWFASTIGIFVLFIYKRSTISRSLRIFLLILIPVFLIIWLVLRVFPSLISNEMILISFASGMIYSVFYAVILTFICYIEKLEIILVGLIGIIIIGFIINRFGIDEGAVILPFAFFLSLTGFIILLVRSFPLYKSDKRKGLIFIVFYSVIAFLNALFLLKFLGSRPALNNFFDSVGVVIFLVAALALFIILPFSDFTDWTNTQKLSFKRLIITPLILFLIIFSLKFLLPDRIYRKIFFKEYTDKERIHFNMKHYEVDFAKK